MAEPRASEHLYSLPPGALRVRWSEDGRTGEVNDQIDEQHVGATLLDAMNRRQPVVLDGRVAQIAYLGLRGGAFFRDHPETVPAITAQFVVERTIDAG